MSDEREEWAAPLPAHRGDRLRALAPALLLIAIAALGVRNHVVHDQSSWQGASFGMFATYENDISRTVVVTVSGPDGSFRASLPSDLRDDASRLRVIPSVGAARALVGAVAELVRDDGATAVDVTVWAIAIDDTSPWGLRFEPLVQATVDL